MYTHKVEALEVASNLNKSIGRLAEIQFDAITRQDEEFVTILDSAIKHLRVAVTKIERGCGI